MAAKSNQFLYLPMNVITRMTILSQIKPNLINYLLGEDRLIKRRERSEKRRIKCKEPHILTVYLAINDPNSYLLLQVIPELNRRYRVLFKYKTILDKQAMMFPEPQLWNANTLKDGANMAKLYGLKPPELATSNGALNNQASLQLVSIESQDDFIDKARVVFDAYLSGDSEVLSRLASVKTTTQESPLSQKLRNNEVDLLKNKHYLPGTIHYGDEWYWGLERLQYLEERLNDLGLSDKPQVKYAKLHQHLLPLNDKKACQPSSRNKLTIYFSIRSPYSYLGLNRASSLAKHYGLELEIKPVLPMLMRNMQVPKNKGRYIAQDTKRESLKFNIPFGKIADPLGKGVERCYALFEYAKAEGKEESFFLNYARCVWSEGILSETDTGLKHIVQTSGLDWKHAQSLLNDSSWRQWTEENLKELYSLGLWGVPSFKFEKTTVFGQDKLLFIEHAIRRSLQLD